VASAGRTLTTFVIEVVAEEGCTLPWFPGHETRAAFLAAVRRVSESLAETLHSGVEVGVRGRRSVMSLKALRMVSKVRWVKVEDEGRTPLRFGPGSRLGQRALVEPGATGWFSVTILDEGVAREAVTTIPSIMGEELTLGPCRLRATTLRIEVVDVGKLLEEAPEDWESIDTYFLTPTYLNPIKGDARYKILYPEINALLANLIATAHHTTNQNYPKPEELANKTYISGIDIKTPKTKPNENTAPTGFIGWTKIRPREKTDPKTKKLIAHLLKLAEKTNTGGNRSAGYGETKTKINTQENQKQPPTP